MFPHWCCLLGLFFRWFLAKAVVRYVSVVIFLLWNLSNGGSTYSPETSQTGSFSYWGRSCSHFRKNVRRTFPIWSTHRQRFFLKSQRVLCYNLYLNNVVQLVSVLLKQTHPVYSAADIWTRWHNNPQIEQWAKIEARTKETNQLIHKISTRITKKMFHRMFDSSWTCSIHSSQPAVRSHLTQREQECLEMCQLCITNS